MDKKDIIEMGYSLKPHGIKGAFSFIMHNTQSRVIDIGTKILLVPTTKTSSLNPEGEVHEVVIMNYGNRPFIHIKGLEDRTELEKMLPFSVSIDRADLPELEDGEFYISDLEGMKVQNETGKEVGVVESHFDNGVQYILTIRCKNGSAIELPFVDQFFPTVDFEKKTIVMNTPEEI